MTREELLKECIEVVTKHRQSQYGTPEDNFTRIAAMWTVYLSQAYPTVHLEPHDVANMMILLKVVRSQNSPQKTDNWCDMAGYAACGCEVATKEPSQPQRVEMCNNSIAGYSCVLPRGHKDACFAGGYHLPAKEQQESMIGKLLCKESNSEYTCELASGHLGDHEATWHSFDGKLAGPVRWKSSAANSV